MQDFFPIGLLVPGSHSTTVVVVLLLPSDHNFTCHLIQQLRDVISIEYCLITLSGITFDLSPNLFKYS